jgi:hypothetical protein
MSQNDTILIQGVKFLIMRRESHRMLLSWTEKSGIVKTRWIAYKGKV